MLFIPFGCKVNQYETNAMAAGFKNRGYEVVEYEEYADVYVVNTCTVTNMSDRKSRQILRRAKEINPNAILCAVGCYAQIAKEELAKIEEIDLILGNNDKKYIFEKVEQIMVSKNKILQVSNMLDEREYIEWENAAYTDKARAEIKVQDGCDRYCTYCIIPYARGPVRSRNMDEIYKEIEKISQTGIKEIVITGIHISSYGKDLKSGVTLIDLLEKINEVEGIERIRLGSLEPLIITEEFVTRLSKLKKICNHFHLSLQSGCDSVLERMNRRYTTSQFREIVGILRKNIPDVALTTDIIVGFPGETQEEFETTYKFLEEIKFSKMHIFKFSPRKGTKAAEFPNQIDGNIKDERSERLIKLSSENEISFATQYIGKEILVLFEDENNGHTSNYIEVVSSEKMKPNSLVNVKALKQENGVIHC